MWTLRSWISLCFWPQAWLGAHSAKDRHKDVLILPQTRSKCPEKSITLRMPFKFLNDEINLNWGRKQDAELYFKFKCKEAEVSYSLFWRLMQVLFTSTMSEWLKRNYLDNWTSKFDLCWVKSNYISAKTLAICWDLCNTSSIKG